ncbi:MAG: GatB/YqeY domain-containing protein [Flavobacteriales bacterium]|nr:GatB/YqeY domain-containing protein [Flavobacteriales bacterium]
MGLKSEIMSAMKEAMKLKDKVALETLRAVKSELLKAQTAPGASIELSRAEEIKLLQKMQKQRKDAFTIYEEQGRKDLAEEELAQTKVLAKFLPKQMTASELEIAVAAVIEKLGASSPSDMGKVMGVAAKELSGKAEGRAISTTVKMLLAK